jgi:hypothetical protein
MPNEFVLDLLGQPLFWPVTFVNPANGQTATCNWKEKEPPLAPGILFLFSVSPFSESVQQIAESGGMALFGFGQMLRYGGTKTSLQYADFLSHTSLRRYRQH